MTRNIIAILRGITPKDAITHAQILVEEGITMIEVPMNSPDATTSISEMVQACPTAMIGAGTVLTTEQVADIKLIGGQFIVSPNCDEAVIKATKNYKMQSYPGVMTPSEAINALHWGADGLKLFPAEIITVKGLSAFRAVLPKDTQCYAVGGVSPDNFAEWHKAGANGFGVGSVLYKTGMSAEELREAARAIKRAYDLL